ncbi:hypothetical protein M758_UG024300 [Ceratodon purpureus]|nr:hypothetical protein M758_UG024300 [Ceratodon purpureus]
MPDWLVSLPSLRELDGRAMRNLKKDSPLPKWGITRKRNTEPTPILGKKRKVQYCREKWTEDVMRKALRLRCKRNIELN